MTDYQAEAERIAAVWGWTTEEVDHLAEELEAGAIAAEKRGRVAGLREADDLVSRFAHARDAQAEIRRRADALERESA